MTIGRAPGPDPTRAAHSRARARLRRAVALSSEKKLGSARRETLAAIEEAPDDPVVLVAAGMILFVTRDYGRSLETLELAARRGAGPRVHWLRRERAARLGWDRDVEAALRDGSRAEPNEPRWHAALLALHAHRRAWDAALADGAALVERAPDFASPWMELAGIHAARGNHVELGACLERALSCGDSLPLRLEAARLLRTVGEFARAREHLEAALRHDPASSDARIALADLALWSADHDRAAELAGAVLAAGPSAAAKRVLGAIAWLEGRRDDADASLRAALELDPGDADAHAWLAEIAIRDGRHDDAHDRLSRAVAAGGGQVFAAHVLRLRLKLDEALPIDACLEAHTLDHHRAALRAICPELASTLETEDREAWKVLVDRALARMHGNRSTSATHLVDGVLRIVPHVRDPRAESRRILERIRVEPVEGLLAELEALSDEHRHSSLPLAHAGELLLWLGRLEDARAALESAIARVRGTRWAYIGLAAIDMLSGSPERALETLARGIAEMRDTTGPAVYVHRGEALRRLGRLAEAEADLVRSVELGPSRVSGWINLALLRIERDEPEAAHEAAMQAFERAPGLLSDASRELGIDLVDDGGALAASSIGPVLERALEMLRGNRASTVVTYVTQDGALRFGRPWSPGAQALHARDVDELRRAVSVLEHGLGVLRQPGGEQPRPPARAASREPDRRTAAPVRVRRAPTLSSAEIEHFLEHGFVRIEGGLDHPEIARWIAEVRARVRSDPRRWMQVDATRAVLDALDRADVDDPSTWPHDVVVVPGDRRMSVQEVAPKLWGAVCDLLGEDTVRTREITDHTILRAPHAGERPAPEERRRGWHVDNPGPSTRLDGITNGLVALALLSDVQPGGGATWIAPGSVPLLVRMLAERGPLDLVDPTLAEELAGRAGALVECTGRRGDVYLTHPLMVHCGSINESRVVRWLSNPNFELRAPLDPGGDSPVERALRRALDA